MGGIRITIKIRHNYNDYLEDIRRIKSELDFSQVVLEGINAIQKFQRLLAPIGRTGKGPHGRIPRSIGAARIYREDNGSAKGVSMTKYGPAIFTNEGTGLGATPPRTPYFISQPNRVKGHSRVLGTRPGFIHPGIGAAQENPFTGMGWWEKGADLGSPIAIAAFERKVKNMLGIRKAV